MTAQTPVAPVYGTAAPPFPPASARAPCVEMRSTCAAVRGRALHNPPWQGRSSQTRFPKTEADPVSARRLEHQPDLGDPIAGTVERRRHRQVRHVRGRSDPLGARRGVDPRDLAQQVVDEALASMSRKHGEITDISMIGSRRRHDEPHRDPLVVRRDPPPISFPGAALVELDVILCLAHLVHRLQGPTRLHVQAAPRGLAEQLYELLVGAGLEPDPCAARRDTVRRCPGVLASLQRAGDPHVCHGFAPPCGRACGLGVVAPSRGQ